MKFRLSWLIMLILSLMLVLAACGGDDADEDADEVDEDTTEETEDEEDDQEEEVEEEVSESSGDNVLVFARGGDSESLDFGSTTDGESSRITKQIYESLLDFEPESFEIKAGLAHDWEVSDDGLTY